MSGRLLEPPRTMTSRRLKLKGSFERITDFIIRKKPRVPKEQEQEQQVELAGLLPDDFDFNPDWESTRKVYRINNLQRDIFSLVLSPIAESEISQATITTFLCQFAELSILIREQPLPWFYGSKTVIGRNKWTKEEMKALFVCLKTAMPCEPPSENPLIPTYRFKSIDRMLFNALDLFLGCVFDHEWCSKAPLANEYHPGTRKEYLETIMEHLRGDSQPGILWLYGLPRTGKSVISWAVYDRCREERRLGAILFFRRGKGRADDPRAVVCRLAGWLHDLSREVSLMLAETVGTNEGIIKAPLSEQFEKLIYEPIMRSPESIKGPMAVILDGLDDCGTPETRGELLTLIRDEFPKLSKYLRFFITSRPEPDITEAFSSLSKPPIQPIYLDPYTPASLKDLSRFLSKNIIEITKMHGIDPVPQGWTLWESENLELVEKVARGRFDWVSEVILEYKGTGSPDWFLRVLEKACRKRVDEMEKVGA